MILDYAAKLVEWCRCKILLLEDRPKALFKEGEIWWCRIGMNVGREIYGKGENFIRPILIFKKFGEDTFLAIPLTSRSKEGNWYILVSYGDKEGRVILNQIKTMDGRRLVKRIGTLSEEIFAKVKSGFWDLYSS